MNRFDKKTLPNGYYSFGWDTWHHDDLPGWHVHTKPDQDPPPLEKVQEFLKALQELETRFGFTLDHEDSHGAFIVRVG